MDEKKETRLNALLKFDKFMKQVPKALLKAGILD